MNQTTPHSSRKYRGRRDTEVPSTVYIVDTNVLHLWVSYCPDAPTPTWCKDDPEQWERLQKRQKQAASFCENSRHDIVIPGIVWVELYGVFLQKDIDLENYEQWRRQRKAALQPLESLLLDACSHIKLGEEPIASELAVDLCRHPASPSLLEALRENHQHRSKSVPTARIASPKCLDGIDSAILAYAWKYAQRHPWRPVRILSDDQGLRMMIQEVHALQKLWGESIPKNLGYCSIWGKYTPMPQQLSVASFVHPQDREARQLFRLGDYEGAAACWEQLQRKDHDPRPHQICADIAKTYACWEQFDFAKARACLSMANANLAQYQADAKAWPMGLDLHGQALLQEQENILDLLGQAARIGFQDMTVSLPLLQNSALLHPLICDLWIHAQRRILQKQHHLAALLFYRLAEMMAQRRLATHQIDTSCAAYTHLDVSEPDLLNALNQVRAKMMADPLSCLPEKIDLINDYALLIALKDPFVQNISLSKLNGIMKARNISIYTHGFQFIKPDVVLKMQSEVEARLRDFWQSERLEPSAIAHKYAGHRFLALPVGTT